MTAQATVSRTDTNCATVIRMLKVLNEGTNPSEIIMNLLDILMPVVNCESVAVRFKDDCDFPYYEYRGFPESFIKKENFLCVYDENGNVRFDEHGGVSLSCMCGYVLSGRSLNCQPMFTEHGSFWTNSSTKLFANPLGKIPSIETRNTCPGYGYESMALIPITRKDEIVGMVHINDRDRDKFTPELISFLEGITPVFGLAYSLIQE